MNFVGRAARLSAAVGTCAWMTRVVVAVLVCLSATSHAQVSVGDSGTPSYGQAIAVPPGVAGMAPKLSLFYAGGGVNGPLGHGWSVQGLSSITRCPTTVAIDGKRAGVTYGASDKLCLDGQRLIQTDASGTAAAFPQANDAAGLGAGATREYRTEKEIYGRIRAYGYANGDTSGASGPAYFRVWTKAGQIYDYGASPNVDPNNTKALIASPGKPPMAWAVARISDTLGNFIDFKYEQRDVAWGSGPTAGSPTLGHEWNILEIQYSGNKVLFNYDVDGNGTDLRPDRAEAYQQGNKNVSLRRLKSITTYVNSPASALGVNGGTAVKTTQLSYEIGTVSGRSRINKIQECAGGPTSTRCLPASTLQYANGGTEAYQASGGFASSPLASLDMIGNGTSGVLLGDFNGDGKTDILYWSDNPANNKLHISNGDGTFAQSGSFNVTTSNLFKSDGCYYAIPADFNGDGITDILRVMRPTGANGSCGTVTNVLYLGSNTGSFTPVTLPSSIDLTQTLAGTTDYRSCLSPKSDVPISNCQSPGPYVAQSGTTGAGFHLMDVNGDGILDIVTTIYPGFPQTQYSLVPTEATLCASITCSHVHLGKGDGTFNELTTTNLIHHSVYIPPPSSFAVFFHQPFVADVNGDGLSDLIAATGLWLSNGDGNFTFNPSDDKYTLRCDESIDFNGDGRADCLVISVAASLQNLIIGDGTFNFTATANFNLKNTGQELYFSTIDPSTHLPIGQSAGNLLADFNGDGRTDILRWKDDAKQNVVYLSNGDGSFTQSGSFNLGSCPCVLAWTQLQKSDGTAKVLLGDFTGRGAAELLRLQTINGVATNILLTKFDATPADQLISVTSSSGLKTSLYYVPLSNATPSNGISANLGPRYQSDRGTAAFALAGAVDVTMPMYVVATSVSDTGVGTNQLATEMSYRGLKVDLNGRGVLGFREVLRQRPGAEGSPLTVDTQYLQIHPYIGVASTTSTYRSVLNAINASVQLSTTTNVYCDQTNAAAASTSVNCPVTAKIAKPYLYWSSESGKDLGGNALPTVTTTNVFNGNGDPTQIQVTTSGSAAGIAQTFTKTTTNTYQADNAACSDEKTCVWILGRLSQASVANTVPNSLTSFASSAGNGAFATATAGTGTAPPPTPQSISPAVLNAILSILLDD